MDHQLQPTIDDKVLSNDLKNLQHVISTESHDFSFGYGYPGYELTQEDEPSKTRDQIIHLIELNKEYQEILSVFVRHIEAAKCRNIELQKKIRAASQSNKRRTTVKKPQGTPFFCDSQNDAPLWNKDTQMKVEQERKVPTHFKFKKWSKSERNCLVEGIVQQNKQILYNEMMAERQNNPDGKSLAETAKMVTEHINSLPKEHFHENIVGIDWEVVSKQFVPTRTAIDCQLQWTNVDHTSINHGSWTKAEDKKLLEVAKRYKHHEWTLIAKELGTNRTAFQCFRRFQRSLNTSIVKGKWTQEEDQALKAAIKQYGDKNWQQVAHCLDGRTGQQCLHRWQKTLHPNIKRGRWTPEEDKALTLAVKAYGSKSWVKVQKHVPGRTDVQCRERWVNILNPKLNVGAWTPEEDKKLEEFVATKGPGKWAEAAARLFPRTDNQCWRRWKTLHQEALNSYRQNILKKKIGMVNNFVGREKERPQLTPEDLDLGVTAMSSQNEYRHESSVPLPLDDISVTTYEESPLLLSFDKKDYPSTYSPHKPLPDSLPLLLPQQDTFEALDRLIRCLGEVQSTTLGSNRLEDEEKLVTNPEFTLLAGVFNGLFLCPTLLHARTYFGVDEEQSHHDVDTTTNIELI